jgi:hypothetical protein
MKPFDQAWALLKGQYPEDDPRIQGFLKPQHEDVEVEVPYTQRDVELGRPMIDDAISRNPELADFARSLDNEDYGFSDLDKTRELAQYMGIYSPTRTYTRTLQPSVESADFANRIQPEIPSRAMEENDARGVEFERRFGPDAPRPMYGDKLAEWKKEREKALRIKDREDDAMAELSEDLDYR